MRERLIKGGTYMESKMMANRRRLSHNEFMMRVDLIIASVSFGTIAALWIWVWFAVLH